MADAETEVKTQQGEKPATELIEDVLAEETPPVEVKPEEPDWLTEGPKLRGELETERQARRKAEEDFQSFKKGRLVAEERDEALEATRRLAEEARDYSRAAVASRRRELAALQDTEGLAELEKQEAEISKRRGAQTADQKHRVILAKIQGIGQKLDMDLQAMNANPAFEEARSLFASQRYDEALIATYEGRDTVVQAREKVQAKEAAPPPGPKAKATPKPGTTDLGPGSGGAGSITADNIDQKYLAGKVPASVYRKFIETGEI